jgi:hypothetical protein
MEACSHSGTEASLITREEEYFRGEARMIKDAILEDAVKKRSLNEADDSR